MDHLRQIKTTTDKNSIFPTTPMNTLLQWNLYKLTYRNDAMNPKNDDQAGSVVTLPAKSGKARRGFASMDAARQKEIASMGGKASHKSGNAHQFTVEEARAAGRKGRIDKQNVTKT